MKYLLFVGTLCAIVAPAHQCPGQSFVPGRIYSTTDNGFAEWNQSLQVQRQVTIPGLAGGSGCVFNTAGNLVMIGYYQGGAKLLEVTGNGAVVRSVALATGALLRGSYVDYNAATNQYIVADGNHLRLLNASFGTVDVTADVFQRASGVAFGADGRIYGSDQFAGQLRVFDTALSPLGLVSNFFERTGLERANNGDILMTSYDAGRLDRYNPTTNTTTPIVTGLNFGSILDVDQLPDGRLVTINASNTLVLYTEAGSQLATGTLGIFGDGVAYYIPSPSVGALLFVAFGTRANRRRR